MVSVTSSGVLTDDETIGKDTSGKIKTLFTTQHALNELRMLALEVAEAVDDSTEHFGDIFTDATGALDKVDSGSCTSVFDTDHYETGTQNDGGATYVTSEGSSTNVTTLTVTGLSHIMCILYRIGVWCGSFSTGGTVNVAVKNSSDVTIASKNLSVTALGDYQVTLTTGDYSDFIQAEETFSIVLTRTSGNFTFVKSGNLTLGDADIDFDDSQGFSYSGTYPNWEFMKKAYYDTDIVMNYDKAKPGQAFLGIFSGDDGDVSSIGANTTYEFVDSGTSESSGELDPFAVETVSMTETPDQLIIHQKATDPDSVIKKFVVLIDEA
jgi:hypothetical protein